MLLKVFEPKEEVVSWIDLVLPHVVHEQDLFNKQSDHETRLIVWEVLHPNDELTGIYLFIENLPTLFEKLFEIFVHFGEELLRSLHI